MIKPENHYDLVIGNMPVQIDGKDAMFTAINGTVPGPLVRMREGDTVTLNVTNQLLNSKHSSIHWHGILVPFPMDGVPGINFKGIPPGETYRYQYEVRQAGTYWYHSHSRFQEQTGTYGPLVIDPKDGEKHGYDRDHVVVLSDWSFEDPEAMYRHINLMGGYYNYQQRTIWDFFTDISLKGLRSTINERLAWGKMRMSPVDLSDVTGSTYTYLMNGNSPDMNWTGLFEPGETLRLRIINASAMTTFDVRIPGLDMSVVMADGKNVQPVEVQEFRIGVAETYDVLVTIPDSKAYTIFAESLDRSGYTRGTLAPEAGMDGHVPKLRPRPVRTMEDIGMGMMGDMNAGSDMAAMDHGVGQPMDHGQKDMVMAGSTPSHDPHVKNALLCMVVA